MRNTETVIANHLARFAARDLDGILADYAEHAVLFTPDGLLTGRVAIRELFVRMLAEFEQPGATFTLQHRDAHGEHGFIVWTAETAAQIYEVGTDTFCVRQGLIEVQSFTAKVTPKRSASH